MKKSLSLIAALCLAACTALSGCSGTAQETTAAQETSSQAETSASEESSEEETTPAQEEETSGAQNDILVRVGSLKGPTSMGLVSLMDQAEQGLTSNQYEFTMTGAADELVGKIASQDLDIALIPANVAATLYAKTQGGVQVIDINTLGVLYVVASDPSITSMADLKGKTIYMTGKGTTPEYAVNYLLAQNGMTTQDVDLQFKSEAAEVVSLMKEDSAAIGVLPQPFATAACIQNPDLSQVLDLTQEWDKVSQDTGSQMVTGVTLVRSQFLEEHPQAVASFLEDHEQSTAFTEENPEEAANLIAQAGIVEQAAIAQKALPQCNIVCIQGQEMKDALSGYLSVLYEQDPQSVGGALPDDGFYYIP